MEAAADSLGMPRAGGTLEALCLVARLHHVAADPAALRHQLGLSACEPAGIEATLLAARHLGLKAKRHRSSADRLPLVPLPGLAVLNDGRIVVLAQCDSQRVLLLDPTATGADAPQARPTIEPLHVFAEQWTSELILITSRASLAGELAKFDFSWFIPGLVKHRKLIGEVLAVSRQTFAPSGDAQALEGATAIPTTSPQTGTFGATVLQEAMAALMPQLRMPLPTSMRGALLERQSQSLVSAMAAFGGGADSAALYSERQTALPVHRLDPMLAASVLA